MQPLQRLLVLAALAGGLAACSTTSLQNSWSDPKAGPLRFQKVVAVAISDNMTTRRAAEDTLVARLGRARAQASYSVLKDEDERSPERAKARFLAAGFDGAVVMRFIGSEKELNWSPGSWSGPYRSFGGYYGYGWGFYDQGYAYTQTTVKIETTVYALGEDKIVWAGLSNTVDPTDVVKLTQDVAEAAAKDLRARGLLPQK